MGTVSLQYQRGAEGPRGSKRGEGGAGGGKGKGSHLILLYACMYVCVLLYTCVCACIVLLYARVHVYFTLCMYVCMHYFMRARVHVFYAHVRVFYLCACVHACIYLRGISIYLHRFEFKD